MVGRVVESVLVRQQSSEQSAKLQQLMPILAGTGQSTHLQPEDQPDVIQADFSK